uniref:Uncharacterized protein n=1 Tax=Seriola dumerili TaxID=41447 RepID=A0A3B4TPE6_SERDU
TPRFYLRAGGCRGVHSACGSPYFQTQLKKSPLLSGFGNRCIQPKGPREPPLEWT